MSKYLLPELENEPNIAKTETISKPKIIYKTKTVVKQKIVIIEFNDIIQYGREHKTGDIECEQFLKHCDPELSRKRGGGGWSGAVKSTLAMIRKILKEMEAKNYDF